MRGLWSRPWICICGPVYSAVADDPIICPWCIADGSAARMLQAEFTDAGSGVPDEVPIEVVDEISHRTPGFSGWQQEHWLYHCDDAACSWVVWATTT